MHILFVCTGNTCRSPMAEAILSQMAKDKNWDISCDSAGIFISPGQKTSLLTCRVLEEKGISFLPKEAKPLTSQLLNKADLVIALTEDHRLLIRQKFSPKTKLIAMPHSIPDPYGGDLFTYKITFDAIKTGLSHLIEEGVIHANPPCEP